VIDMTGPIFVVSCCNSLDNRIVLALMNHFNWFFYFKQHYLSFNELSCFFGVVVWLIPFEFMVL
jgi:hypothetical protein